MSAQPGVAGRPARLRRRRTTALAAALALVVVALGWVGGTSFGADATVAVAAKPVAVVTDPTHDRVFVVSTSTVSVISTTTQKVTSTFAVSADASGAAYSAADDRLYVTSLRNDTVTAYRGGTGQQLDQVVSAGGPYALAFDAALDRLWVTNSEANTVTALKASTLAVVDTIAVGQRPYGLAYDAASGVLAVADRGNGLLTLVTAATGAVRDTVFLGGGPVDVVADPAGSGFDVVRTDADRLTVVTADGTVKRELETGTAPYGVARWGSTDGIVVTESLANKLTVLTPGCDAAVTRLSTGDNPVAVAVVGDQAYVANVEAGTVSVIDLPADPPVCQTPKPPTISTISPTSGSVNGGTVVTLTGTSLADVSGVDFGTEPATDVSCQATSCTVTSPAGTGTVHVTAVKPVGRSAETDADRFGYVVGVPGPVELPDVNLVRDGGFEPLGTKQVSTFETVDAADAPTVLGAAWVMATPGSVDLVGAGADQAAEGTQFIDLNGNNNADDTQTELRQQITTIRGHQYRVSFWMAGNPNGDPKIKTATATFGDTSKPFSFDASRAVTGDLQWTEQSFEVTACTAATTLSFRSTTAGIRGPLLDAIAVVDLGTTASCDTPSEEPSPSSEPSDSVSPSAEPSDSASPSPEPSGSGSPAQHSADPTPGSDTGDSTGPSSGPGDDLPNTGGPSGWWLLVGGLVLVAGIGLLVWVPRRRPEVGRHS